MKNQKVKKMKSLLANLLKTKSPDELIASTKKAELKKTLNIFDLIVIGIGAVVFILLKRKIYR